MRVTIAVIYTEPVTGESVTLDDSSCISTDGPEMQREDFEDMGRMLAGALKRAERTASRAERARA